MSEERHSAGGMVTTDGDPFCEIDNAPASICNGPHVGHFCPNGDLVVRRFDNSEPCPFCGTAASEDRPHPRHIGRQDGGSDG